MKCSTDDVRIRPNRMRADSPYRYAALLGDVTRCGVSDSVTH